MTGIVLAVILAAQPNIFEPSEMSSEVIFASVATCMDKAMPAGDSSNAVAAIATCGCMMDAVRLNTKQGKRPPENNATAEQMAKCHAQPKRTEDARKGKIGT